MAGISRAAGADTERVDWVDIAKGLCIILVVMVHATLGVEIAAGEQGFMHQVVAWARPFRMPDFFLISGLFLSLTIDKPWRRYLDRKVVHFAYFYVLWLTIQFAFKAPGIALERGATAPLVDYLLAFVQPFGTLWFIYVLPVFFLFTRLVRSLPVWFVFVWAALLEALPVHTGSVIFDEFAARYVYFFAGYAFAPQIFALAGAVRRNAGAALAGLAVWAVLEAVLVFTPARSPSSYRARWATRVPPAVSRNCLWSRWCWASPARSRSSPSPRFWRGCPGRTDCAGWANIPSSSTSPSSCRWQPPAWCSSRPASCPTSA